MNYTCPKCGITWTYHPNAKWVKQRHYIVKDVGYCVPIAPKRECPDCRLVRDSVLV